MSFTTISLFISWLMMLLSYFKHASDFGLLVKKNMYVLLKLSLVKPANKNLQATNKF